MAKQQSAQKYIFKISTSRLKKAKWDLSLSLSEARRNDEIISLNDSQMLRWIDELNGVENTEERVNEVRANIRMIRSRESTALNRHAIRDLYDELDRIQFKPDYMHLVVDKPKDLLTACKGFRINDVKYVRLLGTSGGVKCSTIVFVNEMLAPELRRRILNGMDTTVPQIPAKLEAYRALTCSGTTPVSMPRGILVVPDCITKFSEDVIMLDDSQGDEPAMTLVKDYEIELDESDGYGLMLPSLARRWSEELKLNYMASGMNTRFSWEKGMVFTFDFLDFADRVANGKYMVKDAWGHDIDIRNVELILTTSMLKLWKCYKSIDHYLACCAENHYTFGIAKTCPEKLDSWRATNYQFLQSYQISDEQIDELIAPTMREIQDVLIGDWRKALIFLFGTQMDDEHAEPVVAGFAEAMMYEPRVFDDPYVKKRILHLIERRIDDAKIGVIGVHGNYSIVCGDPYALCQNIFGLPVTGLLKAGEIYSQYWSDCKAEYVACFRAPMSCHNNIVKRRVTAEDDMRYWFRYMKTATILNAWDSTCAALNGCDFDGDLVFLTDNSVLVNNIRETPTVFCLQRSAEKKIVTEEMLVESNIAGFGDDIGKVTNRITSMYDVQSMFDKDSDEYRVLDYRIVCGQNAQQACIDKIKGIISKPMPRWWYDYHGCALPEKPTEEDVARREFNLRILSDKKPYFMRYIYPALMRQYNTYIKDTSTKCNMRFRMTMDELLRIPDEEKTQEQRDFLHYYAKRLPVSNGSCVMNRICRRFEERFDHQIKRRLSDCEFDYAILKSGTEYKPMQYKAISKLCSEYSAQIKKKAVADAGLLLTEKERRERSAAQRKNLTQTFISESAKICSDGKQLCDIALDICYGRESMKQFVWDVCAEELMRNVSAAHDHIFSYPVQDPNGDIEYGGRKFSMKTMNGTKWERLS